MNILLLRPSGIKGSGIIGTFYTPGIHSPLGLLYIGSALEKDGHKVEIIDLYQEKSLQLGATDARIISARQVVVDPRVRLKCLVPRCHLYGETPNCPPYTPEPHQMRRILEKYNYAILVKNDVLPAEDFVDDEKWHKAHMTHQGKTHHIVSGVEALAFNDGYYFAAGSPFFSLLRA